MSSFENLVVLADYEERLREARKVVWRDRGEKPVELESIRGCFEHASRGALRAGSLAFAIRAGINLILLLTRIKKVPREDLLQPRSYRLSLIRIAIFGPESLRFAAMLGSFVGTYKLILNALPVFLPESSLSSETKQTDPHLHTGAQDISDFRESHRPILKHTRGTISIEESDDVPHAPKVDRHARLSVSAQAHQEWVHRKTRRWHSVVAGAIAGAVAIRCESSDRRISIAQQLFVRGLQGTYHTFSDKLCFHIPHGEVIVFALSCAQIMYGFTMRPDTLPHWYNSWIARACKVSPQGIRINRSMVREGRFNMSDITKIISRSDIAPRNLTTLVHARELALKPIPEFGPTLAPCAAIHPRSDSCIAAQIIYFIRVFRWMLPIYGALHFVPMVLFRREAVWRRPSKMMLKATRGTARSSAFLGVFVIVYHSWLCSKGNFYRMMTALRSSPSNTLAVQLAKLFPQFLLNFMASKPAYWLGGFMSGLTVFLEEKRRRSELAMYVLPRGLEGAWVMLRGKGYVFHTGAYGDVLLTSLAMGMVMSIYQNDPQHLSGLVRRTLYQFVGPN